MRAFSLLSIFALACSLVVGSGLSTVPLPAKAAGGTVRRDGYGVPPIPLAARRYQYPVVSPQFISAQSVPVVDGFDYAIGLREPRDGYQYYVAQGFGNHLGEDWNRGSGDTDLGDSVFAIANGQVVLSAFYGGPDNWGNVIMIQHGTPEGIRTSMYAHLNSRRVSVGQNVSRGEWIGSIGKTGGPWDGQHFAHLHLELRVNDSTALGSGYGSPNQGQVDPRVYINARRPPWGAVEPKVNFYNTPGREQWTNNPDQPVVHWSVADADIWGARWDHEPEKQFTGHDGHQMFRYIENEDERQGWHRVRVRAWRGDQAWEFSSERYGFDNRAPTVRLTNGPAPGSVLKRPARVDWHIDDPHVGLRNWGQAWDRDPGPEYNSGDGWLEIPEGVHNLNVHTWDHLDNNRNWTFGEFTVLPPAPSDLSARAVAPRRIELSWRDNSSTEHAFEIDRRVGGGGFSTIASVGSGHTTFADTDVQPETGYTYRLRAVTDRGSSDPSNEAGATTPALPVSTPSNLRASVVSVSQIDLAWNDNSDNEASFELERKSGTGNFARVAEPGANITTYRDAGLAPNTSYTYRIRARSATAESAFSNEVTAGTPAALPAAPTSLMATAGAPPRIDLRWTDASSNETGFKLERKSGSGNYAQIATPASNTTSFADLELAPQTTYHYRIRATNAAGDSAYSNEVSATTPVAPPSAPTGLTASAVSSSRINLAWMDRSDNESGFKLERKSGAGGFTQIAAPVPNAVTYSDTGLSPNTTYTYRIRATNGAADSAYSSEASAKTAALGSPTFALGTGTSRGGETVSLDLSTVLNGASVAGLNCDLQFDASRLTFVSAVGVNLPAGASLQAATAGSGKAILAVTPAATPVSLPAGTVARITFRVAQGAPAGTVPVLIKRPNLSEDGVQFSDTGGSTGVAAVTNGVVNIQSVVNTSPAVFTLEGITVGGGQAELKLRYAANGERTVQAQFDLVYDAAKLSFASAQVGALPAGAGVSVNATAAGRVVVFIGGVQSTPWSDGIIARLTLNVLPGTPQGTRTTVGLNLTGESTAGVLVVNPEAQGKTATAAAGTITIDVPYDLNGDGRVDAIDFQLLVRAILRLDPPGGRHDLNTDGRVDAVDAQVLVDQLLHRSAAVTRRSLGSRVQQSPGTSVFQLGTGTAAPGETVNLPLTFQARGSQVTQAQFELKFDPEKLSVDGGITAGTLPSGVGVQTNELGPGRIAVFVGGISSTPWSDGTILHVRFRLATSAVPGARVPITINLPDSQTAGVLAVSPDAVGAEAVAVAGGITSSSGRLGALPARISFGTVRRGKSAEHALVVRNTHPKQALVVTFDSVTGPFVVEGAIGPITLSRRSTRRIIVRFNPPATGSYSGLLKVRSSDPSQDEATVSLTGRGR